MMHAFRSEFGEVDPACIGCGARPSDINKIEHWVFESGYCDPRWCPRCQAEECTGTPPAGIKES